MNEVHRVDFSKIEGPVYTGRDRGESLRIKLRIEEFDNDSEVVEILIPASTYTVSSSFFLGLFGPSVRKLGSVNKFWEKYKLSAPESLIPLLHAHASRAIQGRNLLD